MNTLQPDTSAFARPYVISWNLTYRCNLACEHCYLDAGGTPLVDTENFADRSELGTEECFKVIDEIAAFAPECLTILTGGEPLLRRDILEIVRRAAERDLWVVVGTNGVRITENLASRLAEAGARGLSLSLDALDPDRHDRFRNVRGAWRNTVEGAEILNRTGLPFIVQTTAGSHNLGELDAIAEFAHESPRGKGLESLFPGTDRARAVRVGHHPGAIRRGSRVALPHPEEVRPGGCWSTPNALPTTSKRFSSTPFCPPKLQRRRTCRRSGPTPAAPAAARPGRTTWGYGRTGMSPRAPTSRSSRELFAARLSRICGRPRPCLPTFAAAPRSAGDAASAR